MMMIERKDLVVDLCILTVEGKGQGVESKTPPEVNLPDPLISQDPDPPISQDPAEQNVPIADQDPENPYTRILNAQDSRVVDQDTLIRSIAVEDHCPDPRVVEQRLGDNQNREV